MSRKKINHLEFYNMHYFHYLPARLVRGDKKWYILYFQTDPLTGKKKRFRPTFDLNRIKNLNQREIEARNKIIEINRMLPHGYPFVHEASEKRAHIIYLIDAIEKAWVIKSASIGGENSFNSYNLIVNRFKEYIKEVNIDMIDVRDFHRPDAYKFFDHLFRTRNIAAVTYNNYLSYLSGVFNILVDINIVIKNPFKGIENKRVTEKARRALSDYEKEILHAAIYKHNKILFLAVILIQFCFIRPTELRKLRFSDFKLKNNLIRISGSQSKNKRSSIVTIPDIILPILLKYKFYKENPTDLIFGKNFKPHPTIAIGKNELNRQHRVVLDRLKSEKKLSNTNGISIYSWKDTGAMDLIEAGIDIIGIKDQMRHTSIETTHKYLKKLGQVNSDIKGLNYNFKMKF